MADKFCRKCRAPLSEGASMCKYCLTPVAAEEEKGSCLEGEAESVGGNGGTDVEGNAEGSMDGGNRVVSMGSNGNGAIYRKGNESEKGKRGRADRLPDNVYAALSYLGIAVLVPIFLKINVKFVRFHINQGLVLLISESLLSLFYGLVRGIPILAMVISLLRLLCWFFMVFGAVSAVRGSEKPLPLVGRIRLIRVG